MMSLSLIRELSRMVAAEAAAEKRVPFVVDESDIWSWQKALAAGTTPRLPFPPLGEYVPDGWELLDELFVDKTGLGREDEPALTIGQMLKKLEPGFGYALREEGPFQVFVGKFKKVEDVQG